MDDPTAMHSRPQVPQLETVVRLTSQPSEALRLQSPHEASQVILQAPATQAEAVM